MSFQFNTQQDQDTYTTLSSLIKTNNGQFKSVKQADFLIQRFTRVMSWNTESDMKYFGVTLHSMISSNSSSA